MAQLVKTVKPKILMDLDIDFKSLVIAGFGRASVAYMERFEEEEGPLDDTPIDDDGNTHLHNIAKSGASGGLAGEIQIFGGTFATTFNELLRHKSVSSPCLKLSGIAIQNNTIIVI